MASIERPPTSGPSGSQAWPAEGCRREGDGHERIPGRSPRRGPRLRDDGRCLRRTRRASGRALDAELRFEGGRHVDLGEDSESFGLQRGLDPRLRLRDGLSNRGAERVACRGVSSPALRLISGAPHVRGSLSDLWRRGRHGNDRPPRPQRLEVADDPLTVRTAGGGDRRRRRGRLSCLRRRGRCGRPYSG